MPGVPWGWVYQQCLGGPGEEEVSWAGLPETTRWEAGAHPRGQEDNAREAGLHRT